MFGWFDDNSIARRDRWSDLPDRLQQRVIPRNDAPDHAEGLAQRHVDVRPGHGDRIALYLGRHASEILQSIDRGDGVDRLGIANRLAGIERFKLGELRPMLLDKLRELHQPLGSRCTRHFPPGREGGERRPHGGVDVFLVALGEVGDHLSIAGIEGRKRLAARGRTKFTVDQSAPGFDVRLGALLSLTHGLFLRLAAQYASFIDLVSKHVELFLLRRRHGFDLGGGLHLKPGVRLDVVHSDAGE